MTRWIIQNDRQVKSAGLLVDDKLTLVQMMACFQMAPAPKLTKFYKDIFRNQGLAYVHCSDVIMGAMASQITILKIVYSTVYSGADQRKHQSSASLAFMRGIHRWPVNSPHKWPVTRKMFPFDDANMGRINFNLYHYGITGTDICRIWCHFFAEIFGYFPSPLTKNRHHSCRINILKIHVTR